MEMLKIGLYLGVPTAIILGTLSIFIPIIGTLIFWVDDRKKFSKWYWRKLLKAPFFAHFLNGGNKERPIKSRYSYSENDQYPGEDILSYCWWLWIGVSGSIILWFICAPVLIIILIVYFLRSARRFQKRVDNALTLKERPREE